MGFFLASEGTEGDFVSPELLKPYTLTKKFSAGVYDKTIHNFLIQGIIVRELVLEDPEIPIFSLNALLQAVNYMEEMGKSRWDKPKKRSRY